MNMLYVVAIVAVVFLVIIYNRLVAMRQAWKSALSDIDVQLKQRHDLVPNLVETVKGYASHESGVFEKVTTARASAMNAKSVGDKSAAEGQLTGALATMMAVAENYPDLKANQNFLQLQSELSDIENKIAASRRYFNNAVAEYNTAVGQFPANVIARPLGFTTTDMYALDASEKAEANQAPKVSFGN